MAHHLGEDMWCLPNVFNGIAYMLLFIFAMIWLRLLLRVVEDFVTPQNAFAQVRPPTSKALGSPRYGECEHPIELEMRYRPTHEKRKISPCVNT